METMAILLSGLECRNGHVTFYDFILWLDDDVWVTLSSVNEVCALGCMLDLHRNKCPACDVREHTQTYLKLKTENNIKYLFGMCNSNKLSPLIK